MPTGELPPIRSRQPLPGATATRSKSTMDHFSTQRTLDSQRRGSPHRSRLVSTKTIIDVREASRLHAAQLEPTKVALPNRIYVSSLAKNQRKEINLKRVLIKNMIH